MNKFTRLGLEICLILLSAVAAWFSASTSVASLVEIQKALIGFAGLVVTIFGIWIAVIFPVLSGLLADGKARREVTQLARYDVLVKALYRSCFSLTVSFFVFLLLSLSPVYSPWVARSGAFFSCLTFIATAWALWSAVWNGEVSVVDGINDSLRTGMIHRFRAMGRYVRARSTRD